MIATGLAVPAAAVAIRDAHAQDLPAVAAAERPLVLDHHGQTGIAVLPGTGYRTVVPYESYKDCGDSSGVSSKRVCTRRTPFFVDLQLSHGSFPHLDLLVDVRIGIERDFTGTRQLALAPGVRYWIDPEAQARAFTVFQLVVDHTPQNAPGIADTDFGARVALGFMYDVVRNFGVFVQSGATAGFRRWFRMEVDLGAGGQVRFP